MYVTLSDAFARLQNIVRSHDRPEIDHILVTAGGPDTRGYRYPAEEAIANLLLCSANSGVEAKYIKRVTMHIWHSKVIADIVVTPAP
jgi:hypothetical protein